MQVYNKEVLVPGQHFKFLLNINGGAIAFCPFHSAINQQHKDIKAEGVQYSDSPSDNALAGVFFGSKIEIRGHGQIGFGPDRATDVARLWQSVLQAVDNPLLSSLKVDYMGVNIHNPGPSKGFA